MKRKFGRHTSSRPLRLESVRGNFFSLTLNIGEIRHDKNINVINLNHPQTSGVALLALCGHKQSDTPKSACDDGVAETFRNIGNNVIKKTGRFHFGSTGGAYGIGIVPKYSLDKNTSVGKFVGDSVGEGVG